MSDAPRSGLHLEAVQLTYNPGRSDEVRALQHIDLDVPHGQFVTVVGSNGAGKSSVVGIVSGAHRPTAGRVSIDGVDVTGWGEHRRAGIVARVFDDPRVGTAPELSIEDNLALAASRGHRRGLGPALSGARRRLFRERLELLGLGLEHRLSDRVGLLSAGQRQSLTMIMAGLVTPRVLLLDEHLAALDPATAEKVLGLTIELARSGGSATLMVTHNMDHALRAGDRLIVLSRGRIVWDVAEPAANQIGVGDVVAAIEGAGDAVSDRLLLGDGI